MRQSALILMGVLVFAHSVYAEVPRHPKPPPHAYEDCKGKKAGDTVQHKTREGMVPAKCMDSPEGLVARPKHRPPPPPPKSEQEQDGNHEEIQQEGGDEGKPATE